MMLFADLIGWFPSGIALWCLGQKFSGHSLKWFVWVISGHGGLLASVLCSFYGLVVVRRRECCLNLVCLAALLRYVDRSKAFL